LFPEKKHLNSRLKELKEIIGFHVMENYEINGSNELIELNNIACEKNLTKDNLSFKDFPNQSLYSPKKSIDKKKQIIIICTKKMMYSRKSRKRY
jgi:hypothetical protein